MSIAQGMKQVYNYMRKPIIGATLILIHLLKENCFQPAPPECYPLIIPDISKFKGDVDLLTHFANAGFKFIESKVDVKTIKELKNMSPTGIHKLQELLLTNASVNSDHIQQDMKVFITECLESVHSLKALCRIVIRSHMGCPLSKYVRQLGLPELMVEPEIPTLLTRLRDKEKRQASGQEANSTDEDENSSEGSTDLEQDALPDESDDAQLDNFEEYLNKTEKQLGIDPTTIIPQNENQTEQNTVSSSDMQSSDDDEVAKLIREIENEYESDTKLLDTDQSPSTEQNRDCDERDDMFSKPEKGQGGNHQSEYGNERNGEISSDNEEDSKLGDHLCKEFRAGLEKQKENIERMENFIERTNNITTTLQNIANEVDNESSESSDSSVWTDDDSTTGASDPDD